jgi:hypothetical protein
LTRARVSVRALDKDWITSCMRSALYVADTHVNPTALRKCGLSMIRDPRTAKARGSVRTSEGTQCVIGARVSTCTCWWNARMMAESEHWLCRSQGCCAFRLRASPRHILPTLSPSSWSRLSFACAFAWGPHLSGVAARHLSYDSGVQVREGAQDGQWCACLHARTHEFTCLPDLQARSWGRCSQAAPPSCRQNRNSAPQASVRHLHERS